MRRRFLPSSLGLMAFGCEGKKIAHAAFTFRTKSVTGPDGPDACADSPPPLTCKRKEPHFEDRRPITQHAVQARLS